MLEIAKYLLYMALSSLSLVGTMYLTLYGLLSSPSIWHFLLTLGGSQLPAVYK